MSIIRRRGFIDEIDKSCSAYISAIVLGLNDALVELTGALAGFTMALPDNRIIALAGFTTGVAATLSMAASEFLSQEAGPGRRRAGISALFTGIAYLLTVAILLVPYFVFESPVNALLFCLLNAALIITGFTWAVARMRGTSFRHDCLEMLGISFSVAAIAFAIAWCARAMWGINV